MAQGVQPVGMAAAVPLRVPRGEQRCPARMQGNTMRAHAFSSLLAAALASGCVVTPYNGQHLEPHRAAIDFSGYAGGGGAAIDVLVEDHCSSAWVTVGSTTSSAYGYTYGGEILYPWSVSVDLTGDPNLSCYGTIGINPGSSIHFRVQEDGADLASYPGGGVDCVIDAVNAGDDLVSAGIDCGATYAIMTHRWDN